MKITLLALLTLLVISQAIHLPSPDLKNVKKLDFENFDLETSHGQWLVLFYAPWSGYCRRLIDSVWANLPEEIQKENLGEIYVGAMDCDTEKQNEKICKAYATDNLAYPMVRFIHNNGANHKKFEALEHERTLNNIVEFVKKSQKQAKKDAEL